MPISRLAAEILGHTPIEGPPAKAPEEDTKQQILRESTVTPNTNDPSSSFKTQRSQPKSNLGDDLDRSQNELFF